MFQPGAATSSLMKVVPDLVWKQPIRSLIWSCSNSNNNSSSVSEKRVFNVEKGRRTSVGEVLTDKSGNNRGISQDKGDTTNAKASSSSGLFGKALTPAVTQATPKKHEKQKLRFSSDVESSALAEQRSKPTPAFHSCADNNSEGNRTIYATAQQTGKRIIEENGEKASALTPSKMEQLDLQSLFELVWTQSDLVSFSERFRSCCDVMDNICSSSSFLIKTPRQLIHQNKQQRQQGDNKNCNMVADNVVDSDGDNNMMAVDIPLWHLTSSRFKSSARYHFLNEIEHDCLIR